MLTIDEHIGEDGNVVRTRLELVDGRLVVTVGGVVQGELPVASVEVVMERYGKPLAAGIVPGGPSLALGEGKALWMLRHLARYDVIARDFVVLMRPDAEPLAELSTTLAAALLHLVRAATEGTTEATTEGTAEATAEATPERTTERT